VDLCSKSLEFSTQAYRYAETSDRDVENSSFLAQAR